MTRYVGKAPVTKVTLEPISHLDSDIRALYRFLAFATVRLHYILAFKFTLLTMVRKDELIKSTWEEFNFEDRVWNIPAEHSKLGMARRVYLSKQALDVLTALQRRAGSSKFVLPCSSDPQLHMSSLRLDLALHGLYRKANLQQLTRFKLADLRRSGAAWLYEAGFCKNWSDSGCLSREEFGRRLHVPNAIRYAAEHRHMLQEWANAIDAWAVGQSYEPTLLPQRLLN